MKTSSFALVAVAASASAHISLSGPFVFAGPLADPDAATSTVTHTTSMALNSTSSRVLNSTSSRALNSTSTSTAPLAPRHLGWVTRIRKHASASDLEPAAATAAAKQMAIPGLTLGPGVKPTAKVVGGADVADQLRSIANCGGCGANVHVDPAAATLCLSEHQDVLRTTRTTTTTTKQGEQPRPTAMESAELLEKLLRTMMNMTTTTTQPLVTVTPMAMPGDDAICERLRSASGDFFGSNSQIQQQMKMECSNWVKEWIEAGKTQQQQQQTTTTTTMTITHG